jgi:hypothetical protein
MKTINLHTLFALAGFLFILNANAAIKCETAFGEKTFVIEEDRVVFEKDVPEQGRSISSIDQVRTERRHLGFDKVLFKEGLKHRIHINNKSTFNEVEDYMVITSPKGHEMTYPLSCHKS